MLRSRAAADDGALSAADEPYRVALDLYRQGLSIRPVDLLASHPVLSLKRRTGCCSLRSLTALGKREIAAIAGTRRAGRTAPRPWPAAPGSPGPQWKRCGKGNSCRYGGRRPALSVLSRSFHERNSKKLTLVSLLVHSLYFAFFALMKTYFAGENRLTQERAM